MPTPGGEITSTELWQAPAPEVVLDKALAEADTEEPIAFDSDIDDPYEKVEDDLPELS